MNSIAFIDTEIEEKSGKILDLGGVKDSGNTFHSTSLAAFVYFLKGNQFICGHNIFNHDLKYIRNEVSIAGIEQSNIIDTLLLSPLIFPKKPYHNLGKEDKILQDELNNPLHDSINCRDLFFEEIAVFNESDEELKPILYLLLKDRKEFKAFFKFIGYNHNNADPESLIRKKFTSEICANAGLAKIIRENPVELAYCLALINCNDRYSITPPWLLKKFPEVERIMYLLKNKPCLTGCIYCNHAFDVHTGLKRFFGFASFRTYAGEPLQEQAAKAAINGKSILAIFPTGGGKSITFQLPALMSGETIKGLTVVISPLQSLMKDQVDNLEKLGIIEAVTINGMLDPIDRANSYERVEDGSASIIYISPESLRSKTIERLLLGRKIVRIVIDEAHCFSSWGQDFRVDYLYIGDFLKNLQQKKNLENPIPVSCFTATAKQKVIEDIRAYFKEKLSLDLEVFRSKASRTNLHYNVIERKTEEEKYTKTRELIEERNCPTIIYVSRTYKAYKLAEKLTNDGFPAKAYHGKMDVKEKTENQNAFMAGEVQIIVATSAFGMGVDKKDVGMVIHYEISDSLENYIQEAGRAGRDERITAECFVLFNEDDLGKHFMLLNQTKLNINEIRQVWNAVKKFRNRFSNSALEIARKAGWEENIYEIETRVTTAIAALEEAGYLKRGQNEPKIFANSILTKTAQQAIDKINASSMFDENQKIKAIRIIKKLLSKKSRAETTDEVAESRVDYISDHLGIVKGEVINIINLLREEKILADTKDLTAFIKRSENINRSLDIVNSYSKIENFLLNEIDEEEKVINLKQLNEQLEESGCEDVSPNKLKTFINFWSIKNWIKRQNKDYTKNYISIIALQPQEELKQKFIKRHELSKFIVEFLYSKIPAKPAGELFAKEEVLVGFSVHELREEFEKRLTLFEIEVTIADVEDALFFLSRIEALKIEGGFLVVYNRLTIERLEKNNKIQYKNEDYKKLSQFYENKVQQIHIAGEYAKRMIEDYKGAIQFVDDYFQLNYPSFLNKYFPGSRQNEIKKNITPAKFRELFGSLSLRQLEIIKDNQTQYIAVAAGPGSGKTRLLVHKLASLLLMEDIKQEHLLMLTFSRAAATEFKKRLINLIGNAVSFVDISTFHSYCFDLLGKVGSLEKSGDIIKLAIDRIKNGDVEESKITKTVLVIDEAQDMDADEFALINILIEKNENMRVIAVGDDDQNVYEFRGASAIYLEQFIKERKAKKHELIENYRSKNNLVEFTNAFVSTIHYRLKTTPIVAVQRENGNVKVVKYKNGNLVTPLVNDILSTGLSGSTCVLTRTNNEALQINGLLLKNNMTSRLIQSNGGFNLYNLLEVRFLLDQVRSESVIITDDSWQRGLRELHNRFRTSPGYEVVKNIVNDFQATNPKKKYFSDLEVFIRESHLEDFLNLSTETIVVSTIHKSKGREFDNVFLIMNDFNPYSDKVKRQLYVAMTRAKNNLAIHYNGNYLDFIKTDNLNTLRDDNLYPEPEHIMLHLTHKDVWLDYFKNRQYEISKLQTGQELQVSINNDLCWNEKPIVKFSKSFKNNTLEELSNKGYTLKKGTVNYILYWQKEGEEKEIKIILPELLFTKS